MKKIPIGTKIECTIECIENTDNICKGCVFFKLDCNKIKCLSTQRTDKKDIIFKLIENGTK